MRKVIFRAMNRWGSSLNRGEEISEYIRTLDYDSVYYDTSNLKDNSLSEDIKDSVVVLLKFFNVPECERLVTNNNKIILDVIDCISNGDYTIEDICQWPFDGLIVPTKELAFKARILNPAMEVGVLYHHWDKKHLKNIEHYKQTQKYKFRLAYIGSPGGHFHQDKIDNLVTVYDWEKMTTTSPLYTCHYSVRPEGSLQFMCKPNTKASVASCVGANMVHSRDRSLEKLLPIDYPYYTDTDLQSVQEMAKYAEETFGSEVWSTGLDMMKELKERTSLETIAGIDYINYLKKFD